MSLIKTFYKQLKVLQDYPKQYFSIFGESCVWLSGKKKIKNSKDWPYSSKYAVKPHGKTRLHILRFDCLEVSGESSAMA